MSLKFVIENSVLLYKESPHNYYNQESQQSINSSSDNSLSLNSHIQQSDFINSIPENIEEEPPEEQCCNLEIVKNLNEISGDEQQYTIIECYNSQGGKIRKESCYNIIINKFKFKSKVICGKGKKSHTITAKRNDGKTVVIKRVEKENLTISDYYKNPCNVRRSCDCTECIFRSQPSPPISILSTRSSNTSISGRITFETERTNSISSYSYTGRTNSISSYSYTGRSNSLPARSSLLINSFTYEQNSSMDSIIETETDSIQLIQSYQSSPQNTVLNDSPQNSPQTSILNNCSLRTSIYNNSPINNNNNFPQTSVLNNSSQISIHNNSPIIHPQINKLMRKKSYLLSSTSINNVILNNSQSSPVLRPLSIKSGSSNSSMFVQPPSIHSGQGLIPIELQNLRFNSNDGLPAYITDFEDHKYYYYITKRHGVKQRKLKKWSSWIKKRYFKVNWEDYID